MVYLSDSRIDNMEIMFLFMEKQGEEASLPTLINLNKRDINWTILNQIVPEKRSQSEPVGY